MSKRLFRYISTCILLWIFLIVSFGQIHAQEEFNPTPPPEPGKLTLLLSSNPQGTAYLEQTNPHGIYNIGSEITVRAYPYTDYEFVAWQSIDGKVLSEHSEYTFTLDEKNLRLVAKLRFNPKENPSEPGNGYYNVMTTASPSMGGWVKQSGQGIYENGTEVTLLAYAYPDYVFSHWENNGVKVSEEATYRFLMPNRHVHLRAVYDWNPQSPSEPEIGYCLYVNTSDPTAGYVSQSGNGIYKLGDKVTLIASPNRDYDFIGWYDEAGVCLSTNISYTIVIRKPTTTIEARFQKRDTPVDEVEIGVGSDPDDPSFDENGGKVTVIGEAIPGQQIEIIAEPEPGYAFEGWYLDGVFIPEAEMNHTILIDRNMGRLEAKFRELPIDLEVEGGEHNWAQVTRYRGETISLKAEPVKGHTFMGWYLLDQLLSKALRYDFDVNILRVALPAIRAVYVKGTVTNAKISAEVPVTISLSRNQLRVTAHQEIRRLMIYSFNGALLGAHCSLKAGDACCVFVPERPLLLVIEIKDGSRIVQKLTPQ